MIGIINCLSSYTLLESPIRISNLVEMAKTQGYQAVGLTDEMHLYGVPELFQACQKEGIKPIVGLKIPYLSPCDQQQYFVTLLAKNNEGLHQLYRISTIASQKVCPTLEEYQPFLSNDLYYLSSGPKSEIQHCIMEGKLEQARQAVDYLESILPTTPFLAYPMQWELEHLKTLERLQAIIQWDFIACSEISILKPEDTFLKKVLHGIRDDLTLKALPDMKSSAYIHTLQAFQDFYLLHQPQALKTLQMVIDTCQVIQEPRKNLLPHYPVPDSQETQDYLKTQCLLGKHRVKKWSKDYEERLHDELKMIHDMGFDDYFLIVWDVMREARERHILTAPGRGSAAGSLVAYLLSITEIDPLEYDLLFERFLNPSRQTMPDIDLDFPDYRRDEMYEYLLDKYGKDHVARIITFGTLAAKQVIRDVTKVFGLSIPEQQDWANAIKINAFDQKITLKQAYEDSYALRKLVQSSEKNKQLFQTALQLEGLPRNIGMHAAGVILTTDNIQKHVPLQYTETALKMTQWPMDISESIGLLKMDFLGLRNLTIIDQTLKNIEQYEHQTIDITKIPTDDVYCFEAFSKADTIGIFQFESKGMQNLLQKFQPRSIEDLSLINAIHRPGPSLNSEEILKARKNPKSIHYIDEQLKPILSSTYGFMIYQEQVMKVAQTYAGYTLAEADNLRRAMGKKNREKMEAERQPFLKRCESLKRDPVVSNQLFDQIMAFAGYGFNKSHSIAYSILAYRMMYLKVHYPQCFYMALLSITSIRSPQFLNIVRAMKRLDVSIMAPSINHSMIGYSIRNQHIQMGFGQIKGIDRQWAQTIVKLRKEYGSFQSFEQFLAVLDAKDRQEKYIIPLIEAGVFDEFEPNRNYLLYNLHAAILNATYAFDEKLKEIFTLSWEPCVPFQLSEQLALEKERIGSYLATKPLEKTEDIRKKLGILNLEMQNKEVRALVLIENIRELKTKQGAPMAQLTVEDDQMNEVPAVIFPNEYRNIKPKNGMVAIIYGRWNQNSYGNQIIIHHMIPYELVKEQLEKEHLYLLVPNSPAIQQQLLQILKTYHGMTPVDIIFENDKSHRLLNETYWVKNESELLDKLRKLIGNDHVIVK